MKKFIVCVYVHLVLLFIIFSSSFAAQVSAVFNGNEVKRGLDENADKPNFIIILTDDMGYGDWNGGGNPTIYTPNLNKMAYEGMYMSQFYAGSPLCSPSRASLLTGRNTIRTGVLGVFRPYSNQGLPEDEITIAEALKPLGYKTGCIGKWHLGKTDSYHPLNHGFDYYYGLLDRELILRRNYDVIEDSVDRSTLTKKYTEEAVNFIAENKDDPFFLYLPHTMPHVSIAASDDFVGTSKHGLYGDVIEELDWSVGRVLETLDYYGLSENTVVMFSSDNGPWVIKKQDGGSAGLLRGAKGDTWEGGMRVPTIFRWKGHLPEGKISMSVGSFVDIFPTIMTLAGGITPDDRPMDGIDIAPVLKGESDPVRTIYYYDLDHLNTVRHGKWKLHFRYYDHKNYNHQEGGFMLPWNWKNPAEPLLFDLEEDPSEKFNVADKNPDVVSKLTLLAKQYEEEIDEYGENKDLIRWFKTIYLRNEAINMGRGLLEKYR